MDRYRYFVFNQRSMVVLGLFQIAFSTVCIVSGLTDGVFRTESQLSISRAPVWAGMVMGVPGLLALFSSQRKNPVLEWLQPSEDQSQTVEMICAAQSPGGRIFDSPDQFPAQDLDAEEDASKPPPYIRMA
ncbi:uncharacterized protein AAGF69_003173 isoform 1-T1 [Amazona ochrocephala]